LANDVGIQIIGGVDDLISKNVIAFNTAQGILIDSGMQIPQRVRIIQNKIGQTPFNLAGGNGSNGVRITAGEEHLVSGNTIRANTDGIVVLSGSRRNLLRDNQFIENSLQAIDLSPDGPNAIDIDEGQTGANDQQMRLLCSARGAPTAKAKCVCA
jgi:parallel beta-helix repeat protein